MKNHIINRIYPNTTRAENIIKLVPTEKSPTNKRRFAMIPVEPAILKWNLFVRKIIEIISPESINALRPARWVMIKITIPRMSKEIAIKNQNLYWFLKVLKIEKQTKINKVIILMSKIFMTLNGFVSTPIKLATKILISQVLLNKETSLESVPGQIIEMKKQVAAVVKITPRRIEVIIPIFFGMLVVITRLF
jgi:hypothetical protein